MITYRPVRKNELKEVITLLTESFNNYSFLEIFKDKKKQYKFLHAIHEVNVKTAYKKHIIMVGVQDNKIVSVAQINSPDTSSLSILDYILSGGIKILLAGGFLKTFGFINMLIDASSRCHNLPGRIWYIEFLAVSSTCQGQGLGSKMFEACIIPYIQRNGGGVLTLITNTEQNRVFYKKNGFEEFHEMFIHKNGKEIGNWSYRMNIESQ